VDAERHAESRSGRGRRSASSAPSSALHAEPESPMKSVLKEASSRSSACSATYAEMDEIHSHPWGGCRTCRTAETRNNIRVSRIKKWAEHFQMENRHDETINT
jgi:hypothetical protein